MLKLRTYEIESYLRGKGLSFRRRGQKAEVQFCPFCSGGESGDKYTFVVYLDESGGNYKCMRGKCAESGSFWQLAEPHVQKLAQLVMALPGFPKSDIRLSSRVHR